MNYRRSLVASGTFFFTVNLADRQSDLLVAHVESLRSVVRLTRQRHPFEVVAMVVLPDHLHAIWRLPENDTDYPTRWSLIKAGFSRRLAKSESIGASRLRKRERGIWPVAARSPKVRTSSLSVVAVVSAMPTGVLISCATPATI